MAQMGRKHGFKEPKVVLHNFYVQLLLPKLVSNLNLKVLTKIQTSSHDWPELVVI